MKITLACIIGNEAAVIERFIRSFAKVADAFVFVQAIGDAECDNSLEIAEKTCEELGASSWSMPYSNEVEGLGHVDDFANSRNESWHYALSFPNEEHYVMWADADDLISDESATLIRELAAEGKHDMVIIPYQVKPGGKQNVMRERMVKSSIKSRWRFPVHEQLEFEGAINYRMLKDAEIVHSPLADKTGSHERNVAILKHATADAHRNFFGLAQEYFTKGDEPQFLKWATVALVCPGLETMERYELLLQMAQTSGQKSKALAAEAFALMPDRREALALLCNYAIIDGDHEKAMRLADLLVDTSHPTKHYWTQNEEWYGWKARELYRQCLRLNGRDDEAEEDAEAGITTMLPRFSIIHATLGRPAQALAIRELWLSNARHPENVEYIFGIHESDEQSFRILKGFKHTICPTLQGEDGPKVAPCNHNYDMAGGIATGHIIIGAQDDCYPPDGWDETLSRLIPDITKPVFLFAHDGHQKERLFFQAAVTKPYVEYCKARNGSGNGISPLEYDGMFSDNELCHRAIRDSRDGMVEVVDAMDELTIYHDHPFFNPNAKWDATYENENRPEAYETGASLFKERNPDFEPEDFDRKGVAI